MVGLLKITQMVIICIVATEILKIRESRCTSLFSDHTGCHRRVGRAVAVRRDLGFRQLAVPLSDMLILLEWSLKGVNLLRECRQLGNRHIQWRLIGARRLQGSHGA